MTTFRDTASTSGRTPAASAEGRRLPIVGARRLATMVGFPLIGLAIFVFLWWLVAVAFDIDPTLLPRPFPVFRSAANNVHVLSTGALVTGRETVYGFVIGAAAGVVLAIGMYSARPLRLMFLPLLIAAQAIPKVALAPLFAVWLGFGSESKVLNAALLAVFPVILNTLAGLESVPKDVALLSRALGGSYVKMFWKIRLPQAAPSIFAGLKLAMSLSLIGAVVGEFVASDSGLGNQIQTASGTSNTEFVFVCLLALSILGLVLYTCVSMLEFFVLPGWRTARRSASSGVR